MASKLVSGTEMDIKVDCKDLQTKTLSQLSRDYFDVHLKATEYGTKAITGGVICAISTVLALQGEPLFLLFSAVSGVFAIENQYWHGYHSGIAKDKATKTWVRVDK